MSRKYKVTIGFLRSRVTVRTLARRLRGHGRVMTAKVALQGVGINTFVVDCDEEGKGIVDKYFREGWSGKIDWEEDE